MTKDKQPDKAQHDKPDNRIPINRENQNQNKNAKKQSKQNNDS